MILIYGHRLFFNILPFTETDTQTDNDTDNDTETKLGCAKLLSMSVTDKSVSDKYLAVCDCLWSEFCFIVLI